MICMSCFITGCVRPTVIMCHRLCPRDCPRKTMFRRLAIGNGLRKFSISEQDSRGCSNFGCISGGCYAPEYCARVCPSHCSKRTMFRNLAIGNGLKEKLSKKQDSSELEQRLEKLENIVKNQVNTTHSSESRDFSYSFCLSKMLQKLSYYLGRWKHKVVVNSKLSFEEKTFSKNSLFLRSIQNENDFTIFVFKYLHVFIIFRFSQMMYTLVLVQPKE